MAFNRFAQTGPPVARATAQNQLGQPRSATVPAQTLKDILAPWELEGTWHAPDAVSETRLYRSGVLSFDIVFDAACRLIKDQFKNGDVAATMLITQRHRRIGNLAEEAVSDWRRAVSLAC